jgi:hypothetical protein
MRDVLPRLGIERWREAVAGILRARLGLTASVLAGQER